MNADILLDELGKRHMLDAPALASLKRELFLSGRSIDAIVSERRLLENSKLAELKAAILKVPYKKVQAEDLPDAVLQVIPEETARNYETVPLELKNDLLVVGMVNPDDVKAQEALKFIARRGHYNLGVYLISYPDWQNVMRRYSPYRSEIEAAVKALNIKPGDDQRLVSLEKGSRSEEGPVIRIVAQSFEEAIEEGASDIHIEPQENYLRIRFRVDGILKEVAALPPELAQPVISRVKIISDLKIDETRIPQDGRFRTKIFEREIDFRVATFPTPLGEKVAIRILDPSTGLKGFDQLGLDGSNLETVKAALGRPFGMILVTGPTGSGKTTTLYALLQYLNKEGVNIVSLEDPVEYFVPGVNQSQVRPEINYDFASGLRQILRQDPDIIMVGEIRDNETAGLAVHAALTGHVVLSTLHTNDAVGVIPRLVDMKTEPFLLAASLNLILGQRLVLVLCPDCREAEKAPADLAKIIKENLSPLPSELAKNWSAPYTIYKSRGCNKCHGKGVIGRMAIFEMLAMTHELQSVVTSGLNLEKIRGEAARQGMVTMRQDGILKALAGKVSIEDVLRETAEN